MVGLVGTVGTATNKNLIKQETNIKTLFFYPRFLVGTQWEPVGTAANKKQP